MKMGDGRAGRPKVSSTQRGARPETPLGGVGVLPPAKGYLRLCPVMGKFLNGNPCFLYGALPRYVRESGMYQKGSFLRHLADSLIVPVLDAWCVVSILDNRNKF
jgi:hypothetical protein